MNSKGHGKKWLWPTSRYYPGICLKELRYKTCKTLSGQQFPEPGNTLWLCQHAHADYCMHIISKYITLYCMKTKTGSA